MYNYRWPAFWFEVSRKLRLIVKIPDDTKQQEFQYLDFQIFLTKLVELIDCYVNYA